MQPTTPKQAESYEAVKPLIELIKAGKLFAVQEWIASGQPLNPPPPEPKKAHRSSPLDVAIEQGFHSLVQVLLEGGAGFQREGDGNEIQQALEMRRLDLVSLLVDHGYDARTVPAYSVFATWDPATMEYFVERGADFETGLPLARALIDRIQPVLGFYKRHRERFAGFDEQVNVALRYHCYEGSLKWISLLLWAGADPYSSGPSSYPDCRSGYFPETSAVAAAACHRHYEVLQMKRIRLDPTHPATMDVASSLHDREGVDLLAQLLKQGLNPNDQTNGGSSLLHRRIVGMGWEAQLAGLRTQFEFYDSARDPAGAREELRAVHLLAKHGGKWIPTGQHQVADARRALLKLLPDYTVELVWIMSKYQACSVSDLESVLKTPAMKAHLDKHGGRVSGLIKKLGYDLVSAK